MKKKTQIIILAAGLGKRMNAPVPKVLVEFRGRPIITYILDAVKESGVCDTPVIVVGKMADMVKEALGDKYIYAFQKEQLGTANAVECAKEVTPHDAENILVLYGDQPSITAKLIHNMIDTHEKEGTVLTMATVTVPDFEGWRQMFLDFSRIIRDENGVIINNVEKKDQTEEQKKIKEVNPALMIFDAKWMWKNISNIKNENVAGEYYLTDLIQLAFKEGERIATVPIRPEEALGINSKEHIELLDDLV